MNLSSKACHRFGCKSIQQITAFEWHRNAIVGLDCRQSLYVYYSGSVAQDVSAAHCTDNCAQSSMVTCSLWPGVCHNHYMPIVSNLSDYHDKFSKLLISTKMKERVGLGLQISERWWLVTHEWAYQPITSEYLEQHNVIPNIVITNTIEWYLWKSIHLKSRSQS